MARYACNGSATNTADLAILYTAALDPTPTRRHAWYDLTIGSVAPTNDYSADYVVNRITDENATPGGTAWTPEPLDPADGAAEFNCVGGPTGQPTDVAVTTGDVMLRFPLNLRATFRWVAAPGSQIIVPVTADNGLQIESASVTSAFSAQAGVLVEEY